MKRMIMAFLATLAFAAAAGAADYPAKLAVTFVKAPLIVPSIVAKYNKTFEAAYPGVALTFPELTEGPKQTAALAAGEIGIASCLGSTSALLAASEGLDIRIVGVYSRAPKAFMIVVKDPAIKSVRDLKGKKVAGPKGTILHQLLAAALEKDGMSVKDVQFVQMDLPSGANATIVIATTEKFMKQYPKAVETFMAAHKKSIEWMKKNPQAAKEMTQKETGLPMAGVEAMYPWYDFDPRIRKADIEELVRTQQFMLDNGLQRKKIDDVRKLVK